MMAVGGFFFLFSLSRFLFVLFWFLYSTQQQQKQPMMSTESSVAEAAADSVGEVGQGPKHSRLTKKEIAKCREAFGKQMY